jgi:hypothetical protein
MFEFFGKKNPAASVTSIHAEVDAPLVREKAFPETPSSVAFDPTPKRLALKGVPPQGSLLERPIHGETTTAYIVEGSPKRARLALVTINVGRPHVELWELGATDEFVFASQRTVRLDPNEDSWAGFLLSGVAALPGERLLLAITYYAPHVKHALFVYDMSSGSCTKLSNVVPDIRNPSTLFEAQRVAPETVMVKYHSDRVRLAPEVYYNVPSHLRLYGPHCPEGLELVRLSAADGSVRRFSVVNDTLWLDAWDIRERGNPQALVWSLNLQKVLKGSSPTERSGKNRP